MPNGKKDQKEKSSIADLTKNVRSLLDICCIEVEQKHPEQEAQKIRARRGPKEAKRSTVKSACVAAEQRFSRSDRNPLHVWAAIRMCTNPDVTPMPLPAWCTTYLHDVANGLLAAEGKGDQLAAFIARQLRFTRSGSAPSSWAAFGWREPG